MSFFSSFSLIIFTEIGFIRTCQQLCNKFPNEFERPFIIQEASKKAIRLLFETRNNVKLRDITYVYTSTVTATRVSKYDKSHPLIINTPTIFFPSYSLNLIARPTAISILFTKWDYHRTSMSILSETKIQLRIKRISVFVYHLQFHFERAYMICHNNNPFRLKYDINININNFVSTNAAGAFICNKNTHL